MANEPIKTEFKSLDIEGLRIYKKQNPVKFFRKFGDIDLDNLPEDFNIEVQKMKVLQAQPKTPLLNIEPAKPKTEEEIRAEVARLTAQLGTAPVVVSREEVVEVLGEEEVKKIEEESKVGGDVGGDTLENKQI